MSELMLSLRDVSKKFLVRKPGLTVPSGNFKAESGFFALRNISFDLNKGDIIGVIGENGAGKTTLLKVIAEILQPTSGTIEYFGKVTSILEMGTGFHPDLTGRENIFLSGSLLGMPHRDITRKFDEIVEFSGIGDFIHTPVKYYSSGMYVRLAFSIAVQLDAEILLIDEVISVGDAEFRLKSLSKVREKIKSGISVILVSHNLNEISDLCTRCLLLDKGNMGDYGDPVRITRQYYQKAIVSHLNRINRQGYLEQINDATSASIGDNAPPRRNPEPFDKRLITPSLSWDDDESAPGNENIILRKASVHARSKKVGEEICYSDDIEVMLGFKKRSPHGNIFIALRLFDQLESPVFIASSENLTAFGECKESGLYDVSIIIPARFLNFGLFSAGFDFADDDCRVIAKFPKLLFFQVIPGPDEQNRMAEYYTPGPVRPLLNWFITRAGN